LTISSCHYQHLPLHLLQPKELVQPSVQDQEAQSRLNTKNPEKARINLTQRSCNPRPAAAAHLTSLSLFNPQPQIMNGSQIKQAAIQKAKQVASASTSNGNSNKKRKKELKPIITTEGHQDAEMASSNQAGAG
jgi:hypothetical protein